MADWKKVLGTSVLSASLVFSSFAPVLGNVPTAAAQTNRVVHSGDEARLPFLSQHAGGPFDLGMVNREMLLASLIKHGVISKNASLAQQEKQLNAYLERRAKNAQEMTKDEQDLKQVRSDMQKAAGLDLVEAGVPEEANEKTKASAKKVEPIVEEGWNGEVTTDEILVLLIDFPDYNNSQITEDDNPVLLYDEYTKEHYEDMVFGEGTYKGGNGEDFISMKAYYEQQSGGSYTIDGQVSDWYTAEHPAAYYGGNDASDNDVRPRDLTQEALAKAAQDPAINLVDYDKEDLYDLDGDGNYREPDGLIDHLMIVHAGTGEEAGGGKIGADAIWSHSWNLAEPTAIPGTEGKAQVGYWGGGLAAYAYTVQPEDGSVGVFAHEYGHDLGLPDEYDTRYTANSVGAPTDYWTLMAGGSWAGLINGTEPTGFSPYDKEYLQNKWPESNWFKPVEYSLADIMSGEQKVNIDQASVKGTNADAIKVTLPDKVNGQFNTPKTGAYEYYSGKGNNLNNNLTTTVDLTDASSAVLNFQAYYEIEQDYDYGAVEVNDGTGWVTIPGNITTDENPAGENPGHGFTGNSNGWVEANFDLSAFAGKLIEIKINYYTDGGWIEQGLYVDDIKLVVDSSDVIEDGAETEESAFTLKGFKRSDGSSTSEHYYLIEWRNWAAADTALGRITRGNSVMTLDPGMVIWYVDNKYTDNWVGDHPGDGFLGVVDAHQATAKWSNDTTAVTRYQIQDAAFSLNPTDEMSLDYQDINGTTLDLAAQPAVAQFSDFNDYSNPGLIYAGRNVPKFGLEFTVLEQAEDNSVAQVQLAYDHHVSNVQVSGLQAVYSSNEGHNKVDVTVVSDDETPGAEVTVTAVIVNAAGEEVVSADQSYTSDRNEKELPFSLTLPEGLETGDYTLVATATSNDSTIAASAPASFAVDNVAPIPVVDKNGSTDPIGQAAVTVTIEGAADGTLEYLWSQEKTVPTVEPTVKGAKRAASTSGEWVKFNNGDTLTLSDVSGTWYLHVRGKDTLGNQISWDSEAFTLDAEKPVITLKGKEPFIVEVGSPYTEPGYSAVDNLDATVNVTVTDVEKVDVNKLGDYIVTYTATDTAGNVSTKTRTVRVVDTQKPSIVLNGDNPLTLVKGSNYEEPGFTATDNYDGDVVDGVTVTGSVDTKTVGTYKLTYAVADQSGNKTSVERTVHVKAAPAVNNGTGTNGKGTNSSGNLPNTATNTFNILLAGFITLTLGISFAVLQRRKKGLAE